jgi:prophage tail gpP-like protein
MPESIKITINGQELTQFSGVNIVKSIDHVGDAFAFKAPFFPETAKYREIFRPFKYQDVTIDISNKRQFTGRMERPTPSLNGEETEVTVQGRSKTGVLIDCNFAAEDFPIQFTSAKLEEIAASVLSEYDFSAEFNDSSGALFEEAGPDSPSETVFNFLHNLARQRKLLMSQTVYGNLLFRKAITKGIPVAEFVENEQGIIVTTGDYDSTRRFSSFDMFGQEPGSNDNYAQVLDPSLAGIKRPKSAKSNDTNAANIQDSAKWLASNSIADAISIPLTVPGWLKKDGEVWKENELITLTAPSIMIYKPFTFLIKSVSLIQGLAANTTKFNLTIPGAYSGEFPKDYPWDE